MSSIVLVHQGFEEIAVDACYIKKYIKHSITCMELIKITSKYDGICTRILKKEGPLLGNEFKKKLKIDYGITDNNAGQIIYRLYKKGVFISSYPVKFKHQELLYYLPDQSIVNKLKRIMPKHAPTMHRVYQALIQEDGFLFWSEFEKISAGAIENSNSGREAAVNIFRKMERLGAVEKKYDFQGIPVVIANKDWYGNKFPDIYKFYNRMRDLSFTRKVTIDLLKWLERLSLAGWKSTQANKREESSIVYNDYYFDALGFTYIWGLYRTDKKDELFNPSLQKSGSPLVIESILHRQVKIYDIKGFITRIANVSGPIKNKINHKIIPICFAQSVEREAFELARARGVMIVNINEVFGSKVAESLRSLQKIDVENIKASELFEVLKRTENSGLDGKLGSLRGYVFNFLIASIFSDYNFRPLIGKVFKDPDNPERKCECDIVVIDDELVIICEVKGYGKGQKIELGETGEDEATVKRHFERSYDIVKKETGKKVLPIFITSASFTKEAEEYLNKRNSGRKTQRVLKEFNFPMKIYYNRKDLMELFGNKSRYTEHRKILKEFFG